MYLFTLTVDDTVHHLRISWLSKKKLLVICHSYRSKHQRCSIKKSILKSFTKFTGKHSCQSLFLNKVASLRPSTLLKRDSGTGVFLWILWNFQEHLFYRTPPDIMCKMIANTVQNDSEAIARMYSGKKMFFRIFAKLKGKHLCQILFFDEATGEHHFL